MLPENDIKKFVDKLSVKQRNIESLDIKYNPDKNKGKERFALIKGNSLPGIHQTADYYINLLDHLVALDFSWLSPICESLRAPLQAVVPVDFEGNIASENISLKASLNIPQGVDSLYGFLYHRIKPFVLLYPHLDTMQVQGYNGNVGHLIMHYTIDARSITKIFREKRINKSILEHWLLTIDECQKDNKDEFHFDYQFDAINGRVNYQHRKELVSHYIKLGGM